jgi:hypothetical protein
MTLKWIEQPGTEYATPLYFCTLQSYTARVFPWVGHLWTAQIRGPGNIGFQRSFGTREQAQAWVEQHVRTLIEEDLHNERLDAADAAADRTPSSPRIPTSEQ